LNADLASSLAAFWWLPLAAYLLGSIPFGYLIVRMSGGGDVRRHGSGNIGATNVARVSGKLSGLLTLALDAAKGYAAVRLAQAVTDGSIRWMMVAALLALIGHLFPVWLGFRGGRGVATGAGVFLPVCWQAVLGAAVVWLLVVAFWRYVSLGSLAAAASLPLLVYLLYAPGLTPSGLAPPLFVSAGTSAAMALVIWRHRPNIVRLLQGSEPRFTLDRSRKSGRA
jgi:acyl phosphate:glycerol-3-phosphate acyltransferase